MWDIVFWQDQTVSYVPSCWSNKDNTSYKFPNTENETFFRKLVHDCQDLQKDFSWCNGIAKKTNIKTLSLAKELFERGQYTSNLEDSDDEIMTKSGRLIKKRKLSSETDESMPSPLSEESHLHNFRSCESEDREFGRNKYEFGSKRQLEKNNVRQNEKQINFADEGETRPVERGDLLRCRTAPVATTTKKPKFSRSVESGKPISNSSQSSRNFLSKGAKLLSSRIRSRSLDNLDENSVTCTLQQSLSCSSEREAMEKVTQSVCQTRNMDTDFDKMYRKLLELQYDVMTVSKTVNSIQTLFHQFVATQNINTQESEADTLLSKLPLTNEDDINNFDGELADQRKFKQLVQILYLVGGDTVQKIVYHQMEKIMTNEIAMKYSGQGKKHKLPFNKLKLYGAVVAATGKRKRDATELEIKKMIGLFLATAKSRVRKTVEEDEGGPPEENTQ